MGKIGRNEPCPCGSGIKYKKCCLQKEQDNRATVQNQPQVKATLKSVVNKISKAAEEKRQEVLELGVFILFSTTSGDAWLLEVSGSDGVMLARDGVVQNVNIIENPSTIEVDWSHTFKIETGQFSFTAYKDKEISAFDNYPAGEIETMIKNITQKFSEDDLNKVHLYEQPLTDN